MITYETSNPMADKLLQPDGSMTTRSGTVVGAASPAGAQRYLQANPIADKWLNPDGSISTNPAAGDSMVYPAAGIAVSTGSAWGASINPATIYPAAGIAVSTGSGWGASISPTTIPQIVQAADEETAITQSAANPHNFYFWV
jgi:hypothetical protein